MKLDITEEQSLWVSLHDGVLESLTSDRLARSVTLIVDVPYIWQFHALPDTSRFHVVVEHVRNTTALDFMPWPGRFEMPQSLTWDEQQVVHTKIYGQGRLQSTDWDVMAAKLQASEDYEITNASLALAQDASLVLRLHLMNSVTNDYPQIEITGGNVCFCLHPENRELSLEQFIAMGGQYWEDFGKGTHRRASSTEH